MSEVVLAVCTITEIYSCEKRTLVTTNKGEAEKTLGGLFRMAEAGQKQSCFVQRHDPCLPAAVQLQGIF
ncbi:hypothetical protein JOQ06_024830 [Pogonophryne albipinna]|uniref:Uncharacterized protein n=1 Tax=Pogonophryne albipinna TaxID=1090488 RepID=A0AAD6AT43_9TELE|nr:hypothetical protein JOQ06_024830 [Pogonophryne albipinna]